MPRWFEPVAITPERDVVVQDGRFWSGTAEPWLRLTDPGLAGLAGRFVEIAYRLSFWDAPARPVFRFWQGERFVDRIGVGPIAGRATWIGRVPTGTTGVSVSPTNQPGPFDFKIEGVRHRRWPALVAHGLRWHPRPTRSAVLTRLIGWRPESDVNLAWAIGSIPLSDYPTWQRTHVRELDLARFDRPRFDWDAAEPVRVVILANGDDDRLRRSLASLQTQVFPSWRAIVVGAMVAPLPDSRVRCLRLDQAIEEIVTLAEGTLCGALRAGDVLRPMALAILAERARRSPQATIFYGDEAQVLPDRLIHPILKPGWSPRLQVGHPYWNRAVFVRGWTRDALSRFLASGVVTGDTLASCGPDAAVPLRRILVETTDGPSPPASRPAVPAPTTARATIIIPTKDHPALLQRLIASIRVRSRPGSFRIVVVDNASVSADTKACLDTLRQQPDVAVLDHPGAFNFSLICNAAAAVADTDVVVFLNDDMEVLSDGWLDRLIGHAMAQDVGAVGARLTFPDGRLQHVGVLVGMGESAGHFGSLAPSDDPGWAGRNTTVHEVSAVTGACLAVARQKFEAVGGFDAEHLPIELSDIDLCLKLNARGWQTIVDPAVHLMHEESASRGGATLRRLTVHDRERAIFVERWRHVLRDDPFFHPGLSLYRWQAALG